VNDFVIKGVATEFDKPFVHGDKIQVLKSGCFDSYLRTSHDVKLLINHEGDCLASQADRLMIHAGARSLVFQFLIPESVHHKAFADFADDLETYMAVSIGYGITKSESILVDGVRVLTILEARLDEISLLDKAPAVDSTYARVACWDRSSLSLESEYKAGLFEQTGRCIGIQRALAARENGGIVKYNHAKSPYERTADNFVRALQRLQ
jgi:phage head maturation protease